MSFILDALKKSENERKGQQGLGVADVPVVREAPGAPSWIWWLLALLGINVIVLMAVLLRPHPPDPAMQDAIATGETTTARPAPVTSADTARTVPDTVAPELATVVNRARSERERASVAVAESAPAPAPDTTTSSPADPVRAADETRSLPEPQPATASTADSPVAGRAPDQNTLTLPTLNDLRVGGEPGLPDLHLDIHVWSEQPRGRFVYVNTVKYREGEDLAEGPRVASIVPEGVVLEHRGRRFLLPRE